MEEKKEDPDYIDFNDNDFRHPKTTILKITILDSRSNEEKQYNKILIHDYFLDKKYMVFYEDDMVVVNTQYENFDNLVKDITKFMTDHGDIILNALTAFVTLEG